MTTVAPSSAQRLAVAKTDPGAGRGGDHDHLALEQPVAGRRFDRSRRRHTGTAFEVSAFAVGAVIATAAALGSGGRPRTRSPMTLCWISLEPP